jgi:hypothetical protein
MSSGVRIDTHHINVAIHRSLLPPQRTSPVASATATATGGGVVQLPKIGHRGPVNRNTGAEGP